MLFRSKDYEASGWFGLFAPAGTPADIVGKLSSEAQRAITAADVREKILQTANEPWPLTPQEFAAYIRAEIVKWGTIVKQTGTTVQQ